MKSVIYGKQRADVIKTLFAERKFKHTLTLFACFINTGLQLQGASGAGSIKFSNHLSTWWFRTFSCSGDQCLSRTLPTSAGDLPSLDLKEMILSIGTDVLSDTSSDLAIWKRF